MNLIMNAVMAEAKAKEAKAVANLNTYMATPAGVGEHPDIVTECSKLIKEIAEARELADTVNRLLTESKQNNNQ
jgi:ribosomal protein S16